MEQHSIPRQITTFEFKLIGFLTLKQFIFLVVFAPIGFLVYKLFPVPYLNIVLGALVAGVGAALAFIPINDRPLDVWIRNLVKRMTSPTQYMYHKHNPAIYFLQDLYFVADPHRVLSHIESQEKLAEYLAKTRPRVEDQPKKQTISKLFQEPRNLLLGKKTQPLKPAAQSAPVKPAQLAQPQPAPTAQTSQERNAFFTGVIKNHKLIPLPGIMIYVKDDKGDMVRLLKTNPHGVFATFSPLPTGQYIFEPKDPRNGYFFDTMKIPIELATQKPIEIFSRELL